MLKNSKRIKNTFRNDHQVAALTWRKHLAAVEVFDTR